MEPFATNRAENPCKVLQSRNVFISVTSTDLILTEEPLAPDCEDEAVQGGLVLSAAAHGVCGLVHYPRLDHVRRGAHDGPHQPGAGRAHGVGHGVVLHAGVVQDPPLHAVVGAEVTQVDQRGAPHIGPAAPPQPSDAGLL